MKEREDMTKIIKLPKPQKDLDFPFMKALEQRSSKREWKDCSISDQELSNLLSSYKSICCIGQRAFPL